MKSEDVKKEVCIIVKSSRKQFFMDKTHAYSGPSCDQANVPKGKIYDSWQEAAQDAEKLAEVNPVGFSVIDITETVKLQSKLAEAEAKVRELERENNLLKESETCGYCDFGRKHQDVVYKLQTENAVLQKKLEVAVEGLKDLKMPLTRTDYTIGKLDSIVRAIAESALNDVERITAESIAKE